MVEPCSNQPISSPLASTARRGMRLGPCSRRVLGVSRKCSRTLATRTAATGISRIGNPEPATRDRADWAAAGHAYSWEGCTGQLVRGLTTSRAPGSARQAEAAQAA